jgi:uncharacterized protein YndB with AHSA1/START domain
MRQPGAAAIAPQGDLETIVQRHFDAMPSQLFAALTTPELLKEWLSANGRTLVDCEIDLRPGGTFRYVFRSARGRTFGMFGTYREVVRHERIVHTESYDGYDWAPLVTTTTIRESAGGSTLMMTIRYPSPTLRDSDLPNVRAGTSEGYQRLDRVLAR